MRCRDADSENGQRMPYDESESIAGTARQSKVHGSQVADHPVAVPVMRASISTEKIMQAVQQQRRITQQFEHILRQQEERMEQIRPLVTAGIALGLLAVSSIPLFCVILLLTRTDLLANGISLFGGFLDICIILSQYLLERLTLLTQNTWLLSGTALAVVVMMGMWLRLMRSPQEA